MLALHDASLAGLGFGHRRALLQPSIGFRTSRGILRTSRHDWSTALRVVHLTCLERLLSASQNVGSGRATV